MRSLHKVRQQHKGKKTRAGKTYIGNDLEVACTLLGIPFDCDPTDYDDDDPHVLEAATDTNAERRRETQGQAICTAVRTRLFHEEIQKQRPFHQMPGYKWLAQKFVGSERSHRSVSDGRKVLDLCPDLFACIERDYVTVAGAKQLLDQVDKAKWPEIVRILNDDRKADADNCDGEQDVQSRLRWRGDERIAPFLQRPKIPPNKKERRTLRSIVQDQPLLGGADLSLAGLNDTPAPVAEQDQRHEDAVNAAAGDSSKETVDTPPPATDMPIADAPSPDGSPQPAPGQEPGADDVPSDAIGIFAHSLAALVHLQELLSSYRATYTLIEALETTLNAAQESRQ
jgi:hypothetical protein